MRVSRSPFRGWRGRVSAYRAYLHGYGRRHSAEFCGSGGLYVRVVGITFFDGAKVRIFLFYLLSEIRGGIYCETNEHWWGERKWCDDSVGRSSTSGDACLCPYYFNPYLVLTLVVYEFLKGFFSD